MRDAILLVKATDRLRDKLMKRMKILYISILIIYMAMNIVLISMTRQSDDYSNVVINFLNMANFSTLYIIILGNIYRINKTNVKNDFIQFAVQLPVSKAAMSKARLLTIWLGMLPSLIVLVYQNIICSIRGLSGFTGYIGFCSLVFFLQLIILSVVSGFNAYINPRGGMSLFFSLLSVSMIFLSAIMVFASIVLNKRDMTYGMFGTAFSGVFRKLELISGNNWGILIVLFIIVSYFLCCILPEKLFTKKGWMV